MKNKIFIVLFILIAFICGLYITFLNPTNETSNQNIVQEPKKERKFDPQPSVPVSYSNSYGNKLVFKSFFASDNDLDLNEFTVANKEIYFKKIISFEEYSEYKELIPDLRTLTEDDFVNYYLIIALSKDTNSVYMFNELTETEGSISLEILKNPKMSEQETPPIYSGVAIVLPNITEVPNENIKFTVDENAIEETTENENVVLE